MNQGRGGGGGGKRHSEAGQEGTNWVWLGWGRCVKKREWRMFQTSASRRLGLPALRGGGRDLEGRGRGRGKPDGIIS